MNIKTASSIAAAAFGLALLSGTALAATQETDAWAKEAFADPCMNGDVPADGIVRADQASASNA